MKSHQHSFLPNDVCPICEEERLAWELDDKLDEIKDLFLEFEELRLNGITNMANPVGIHNWSGMFGYKLLHNMTREEHTFIMKNYRLLKKAHL